MAYLVVTSKGKESYRIKLDGASPDAVVVGRAVGSGVWIHDGMLSRQHCKLQRQGGQWWVEDLRSTNGTSVNGHRIKSPRPLSDGEAIEVGDSRLVFHSGAPVTARPADPIEAMRVQKMLDDLADSRITSQETLLGHKTPGLNDSQAGKKPEIRPKPAAAAAAGAGAGAEETRPLAFQRPPATPMVEPEEDHKGWLASLVAKVTQPRGAENRNSNDE